jgi:glycosyltransferase involved in cell wall biosynthesis
MIDGSGSVPRRIEGGLRVSGTGTPRAGRGPLVSIVTVCLNSVMTLARTVESVLAQTYENVEYIVVDGGSSDNTVAFLKDHDSRIDYWVSEPDQGIYYAMNKGIGLATGTLVGIINSDDWYDHDAVESAVEMHLAHPEAIVYGMIRRHDGGAPHSVIGYYSSLLADRMIPHPATFVPMSVYRRNGVFDTNYRIAADYELMLRMRSRGVTFKMVEKVFANFSLGGASARNAIVSRRERARIQYAYGHISRRTLLRRNMRCAVDGLLSNIRSRLSLCRAPRRSRGTA